MAVDSGVYASPKVAKHFSKGYATHTAISLQESWKHKTGPSARQGPYLRCAVRHARVSSLYDVLPQGTGERLPTKHHMCDGVKPVHIASLQLFAPSPSDQLLGSEVRLAYNVGYSMDKVEFSVNRWNSVHIDLQSVHVGPAIAGEGPASARASVSHVDPVRVLSEAE